MIPITIQYDTSHKFTDEWLGAIKFNAEKINLPKTETPRTVLCFTSWSKRIDKCARLITEILEEQTLVPDYIFLTLSEAEFPNYEASLPADLLNLINSNDRIKLVWNGDFNAKHFKKILPILPALNDEDKILVIDDDVLGKLPNDLFESRIADLDRFDRPITFNLPANDFFVWLLSGSGCFAIKKKMLKGWDAILDDNALLSFNDDDFLTRIAIINGYRPITATKYYGPIAENQQYCTEDDFSSSSNGYWEINYNKNSELQRAEADDYYKTVLLSDDFLDTSRRLDFTLPIAIVECDQERFDTILYNCIKSVIISNYQYVNLEFTIFANDYINTKKVKDLLSAYNIKHTFLIEKDIASLLEYVSTFKNFSGPYNKLAMYEYMRTRTPWFMILDDDIIDRHTLPIKIFNDFLASNKPIGLVDDHQFKNVTPVLYTDKYNLEKEYNTGVVLVNSSTFPADFLVRLKEVNDEFYSENPDMPLNMAEQTPMNILLKDSVYELPDELNFKSISADRQNVRPSLGQYLHHYAGIDKHEFIKNPNDYYYGWLYVKTSKFVISDSTNSV